VKKESFNPNGYSNRTEVLKALEASQKAKRQDTTDKPQKPVLDGPRPLKRDSKWA
jgi:hypothetical protein